ncbi:cupin domain-containing protein [Pedobacter yulinensis]|uniref:Cupin domain-containing protein n=1 Tax=Pedobacter yulinensis TaxID=2126353 RepID=A0A2T3HHI5_9SPHI|nr:cupin domain-containing protein [Pedobacter yulinensis]PST81863.1 cupin domain-containing protein [Pedobacter yulinensis]
MTLQELIFIEDDSKPWQPTDPGVRRKIMHHTPELMLVKVQFEQGAVGYLHQHPHLQMSYVAEGIFEVQIGDAKRVLKTGDVFFAPSGRLHGVTCLEAGMLIDVFNPMREDFLK